MWQKLVEFLANDLHVSVLFITIVSVIAYLYKNFISNIISSSQKKRAHRNRFLQTHIFRRAASDKHISNLIEKEYDNILLDELIGANTTDGLKRKMVLNALIQNKITYLQARLIIMLTRYSKKKSKYVIKGSIPAIYIATLTFINGALATISILNSQLHHIITITAILTLLVILNYIIITKKTLHALAVAEELLKSNDITDGTALDLENHLSKDDTD